MQLQSEDLPKTPVFLWRWCPWGDTQPIQHLPPVALMVPATVFPGNSGPQSCWPFATQPRILLAAVLKALIPKEEKSGNWFVSALWEPANPPKLTGLDTGGGKKHPQKTQMKQKWTSDCLSRQHQPNLIKEPRWWNTLTVSATDLMKDL